MKRNDDGTFTFMPEELSEVIAQGVAAGIKSAKIESSKAPSTLSTMLLGAKRLSTNAGHAAAESLTSAKDKLLELGQLERRCMAIEAEIEADTAVKKAEALRHLCEEE